MRKRLRDHIKICECVTAGRGTQKLRFSVTSLLGSFAEENFVSLWNEYFMRNSFRVF